MPFGATLLNLSTSMCARAGLVKEISFGISLFQLVDAAVNNSCSFGLE
jgi:hypothetical protein